MIIALKPCNRFWKLTTLRGFSVALQSSSHSFAGLTQVRAAYPKATSLMHHSMRRSLRNYLPGAGETNVRNGHRRVRSLSEIQLVRVRLKLISSRCLENLRIISLKQPFHRRRLAAVGK